MEGAAAYLCLMLQGRKIRYTLQIIERKTLENSRMIYGKKSTVSPVCHVSSWDHEPPYRPYLQVQRKSLVPFSLPEQDPLSLQSRAK